MSIATNIYPKTISANAISIIQRIIGIGIGIGITSIIIGTITLIGTERIIEEKQ